MNKLLIFSGGIHGYGLIYGPTQRTVSEERIARNSDKANVTPGGNRSNPEIPDATSRGSTFRAMSSPEFAETIPYGYL
ncbi:hypothetical protein CCACVL1_03357 [Corchorus capsularis]|uniref:Uncharacterized protein n=1 Tax=Corchorus capsularis TaxID=210143 RepID=A0A1R3K080_COCAP|nr:hypothetical protein CCACVL1_03357 [Corchorus capsularis]